MTDAPVSIPDDLLAELPDGWEVEMNVPLDTLKEHPRNPRRGNLAKIRESIREHGFVDVVIAQTSTRHIMAGNHRAKAARLEGHTVAPIVIWSPVDDTTAERFMLAHNRSSDEGDYDRRILLDVLRDLDASADGLTGTLYEHDEIDELRRITGELGDDVAGFLDDLRPDEPDKPRGSGSETVTHVTFPFDQDQRDRTLAAVNAWKQLNPGVESSAIAVAAIADFWIAHHQADV